MLLIISQKISLIKVNVCTCAGKVWSCPPYWEIHLGTRRLCRRHRTLFDSQPWWKELTLREAPPSPWFVTLNIEFSTVSLSRTPKEIISNVWKPVGSRQKSLQFTVSCVGGGLWIMRLLKQKEKVIGPTARRQAPSRKEQTYSGYWKHNTAPYWDEMRCSSV